MNNAGFVYPPDPPFRCGDCGIRMAPHEAHDCPNCDFSYCDDCWDVEAGMCWNCWADSELAEDECARLEAEEEARSYGVGR